jgi:phospholipase C
MRVRGGLSIFAAAVGAVASCSAEAQKVNVDNRIMQFKHFVIIYQENHSFDNLYGFWGTVNGEPVNGQANADPDPHDADPAG